MAELASPCNPGETNIIGRNVTLRDWYVSNYCGEAAIQQMMRVQAMLPKHQGIITKYSEFLSMFGEPPFYTFFIPITFWLGLAHEAALFCTMMSVTLYFVDNMKDIFACPRPPCPPLRRAGKDSHGMEYGMPSTHTGLGMMCTYHVCYILTLVLPNWVFLIWLIGGAFVVQTALSRMYLGLHWPADLAAGALVFAFSWLLQEVFLRDFVTNHVVDAPNFPWFMFLLSHIGNIVNATPKDPCPCYEDTVRFFGAAAGATVGAWIAKHDPAVASRIAMPREQLGELLFTMSFWLHSAVGVMVIAVCKTIASAATPRILKPLYVALCGAHRDRLPAFLQPPYIALCTVVGLMFGKRVYPRGMPSSENDSSHVHVCATGGCAPPDGKLDGDKITMISSGSPGPLGRGQVWSLKTHSYWWLWDIHTKSVAYIVVGLSATTLVPTVLQYLFHTL